METELTAVNSIIEIRINWFTFDFINWLPWNELNFRPFLVTFYMILFCLWFGYLKKSDPFVEITCLQQQQQQYFKIINRKYIVCLEVDEQKKNNKK